ncbi:hypothetical protein Gotri_017989 [Gossypium trilobum]|uniref:Uncharacterized protein n=1 Tax=Gossypium trilobum TaxID=34281 RepID=A0A7J9E8C4_9ROSI|nr:hypothetical protein [Gossypium trilobum]
MESFKQVKENGGVIDQTMEEAGATNPRVQWKQMGYEEKTITVREEMKILNQLPTTNSYVTHRMCVLNKILQLLSIQFCEGKGFDDLLPSCLCQIIALQEEELELLFGGLSL